jgi:hypothetical protein
VAVCGDGDAVGLELGLEGVVIIVVVEVGDEGGGGVDLLEVLDRLFGGKVGGVGLGAEGV